MTERPLTPPPPPPTPSGLSIDDCRDVSPIIAAPAYPETEANDGRCRCGRLAVEDGQKCEWHPTVRAHRLERLEAAIGRMTHEAWQLRSINTTILLQQTGFLLSADSGVSVEIKLEAATWRLTCRGSSPAIPDLPEFPLPLLYRAQRFAADLIDLITQRDQAIERFLEDART